MRPAYLCLTASFLIVRLPFIPRHKFSFLGKKLRLIGCYRSPSLSKERSTKITEHVFSDKFT